jgi:hypothetical protein
MDTHLFAELAPPPRVLDVIARVHLLYDCLGLIYPRVATLRAKDAMISF